MTTGTGKDLSKQERFNMMDAAFDPDMCKKTIELFISYARDANNFYSTSNPDKIESVFMATLSELDYVCNVKQSDQKYKVKFTLKTTKKVVEDEEEK